MRRLGKHKEPIKLNLGCGKDKGMVGIDIKDLGQEVVWDLRQGIPFPDGSVDYIYSSHFLEHLTDEESIDLLREVYRVLKEGAEADFRLPCQKHPTAYYFNHKTFWNSARINTLTGVLGLEKFKIVENKETDNELFFTLKK